MATKYESSPPWFKAQTAVYHRETAWMTLAEKGILWSLQMLYWENECRLPPFADKSLRIEADQQESFEKILEMYFPDGRNEGLDSQLEAVLTDSAKKSLNAKKRWESKPSSKAQGTSQAPTMAPPSDMFDQPAEQGVDF